MASRYVPDLDLYRFTSPFGEEGVTAENPAGACLESQG